MADIKVGVQWAPALSGAELSGLCRELEDLGYYSVGFPDHYFVGHGPVFAALHEPFVALAYAAACTSTLRLVSIVAANDFRHPAEFARSVASVDVLSSGRVEAGIGAGWFAPEYRAIGLSFDEPSTRVARLEESIKIIKQLWTTDSVSFEGEFYKIEKLPSPLKPIQKPHPSLLIGAGGPKMLDLAGRHADIVGITTTTRSPSDRESMYAEMMPDVVARKVARIEAAARNAGRATPVIQVQVNRVEFEGEDPGHLWALTGDPSRIVDILHRRAEMGITYLMFRERRIERLREFGERVIPKL